MAIIVTRPVSAPTGLTATLQDGGNLEPNTTYYCVMVAYNDSGNISAWAYYATKTFHSDLSNEISFTTTDTKKSVLLNWNNSAGASRYKQLITKISGDYTNATIDFNTDTTATFATSGVTGILVSNLPSKKYVICAAQLANNLPGGISKLLGDILVSIDGGSVTLTAIYNSIVAAGFANYVSFKDNTFIGRVSIIISGTAAGSLIMTKIIMVLIRGYIINNNPNYTIRFGVWTSETIGADYTQSCHLDLIASRFPVYSNYPNIEFYGGKITTNYFRDLTIAEPSNNSLYCGGAEALVYNISKFRDLQSALNVRFITSSIRDLKIGAGNNWGGTYLHRIKITTFVGAWSWVNPNFYNCLFPDRIVILGYFGTVYEVKLYDCTNTRPYNKFLSSDAGFDYGQVINGYYYNPLILSVFHTLKISVSTKTGVAISGASINIKDVNGNNIDWWSIALNSENEKISGTATQTDKVTDVNGLIPDYFVKCYYIYHLQNYAQTYNVSNNRLVDLSPFTITVTKEGYLPMVVKLSPTNPVDLKITLIEIPQPKFFQRIWTIFNGKGNDTSKPVNGSVVAIQNSPEELIGLTGVNGYVEKNSDRKIIYDANLDIMEMALNEQDEWVQISDFNQDIHEGVSVLTPELPVVELEFQERIEITVVNAKAKNVEGLKLSLVRGELTQEGTTDANGVVVLESDQSMAFNPEETEVPKITQYAEGGVVAEIVTGAVVDVTGGVELPGVAPVYFDHSLDVELIDQDEIECEIIDINELNATIE